MGGNLTGYVMSYVVISIAIATHPRAEPNVHKAIRKRLVEVLAASSVENTHELRNSSPLHWVIKIVREEHPHLI